MSASVETCTSVLQVIQCFLGQSVTLSLVDLNCRLYKVHEEDGKPFELEMSWICEESGRKHQKVSRDGVLQQVETPWWCIRALVCGRCYCQAQHCVEWPTSNGRETCSPARLATSCEVHAWCVLCHCYMLILHSMFCTIAGSTRADSRGRAASQGCSRRLRHGGLVL